MKNGAATSGAPAPTDRSYESITIGEIVEFSTVVSDAMVDAFAAHTGDHNPMHTDDAYARAHGFTGRIAHGMVVASLFSTLLGMHCPGKRNLYLAQSLNFRKPVYPGTTVTVRGTVLRASDSTRTIGIRTEILAQGVVVVDGEATVKVFS